MKTLRSSFLLLGLILFLSACQGNEVALKATNFEDGEVTAQQNLVFSFNKDIFPDSLLQQWDTTHYIDFKPSVPGSFRWTSSSELQFSPAKGFAPGTKYTATLQNPLMARANKELIKGSLDQQTVSFHTAPLRVEGVKLSYAQGRSQAQVVTQLDLSYNYDLNVQEAAVRTRLSSGGQPVRAQLINSGVGKTVSLQFFPLNESDKETDLKIQIEKGIPLAEGAYKSEQDTTIKTNVPSRYNLAVTNISSQHTGAEAIITLNTTQPVLAEGLQQQIKIEPNVPFVATASESGITIKSASMNPESVYQLTISKNLQGQLNGKMKDNYSEQITFGKLQPAITFTNSKGMYLSSRGFKNLSLQIVNEEKVEVTVVKVYENNLEQLFRAGTSYGYDYNYDDEGGDWDGGSYDYYNTENLGDTIEQKTYLTSKLPKQNAARILHLDFVDKLRDFSGLYVITVASADHRWVQSSKILNLSDIGLIVKEDKDNVYVWANGISDAKPMSDVRVSFISSNNQRLYQATTDRNGLCVFSNRNQLTPGFRMGMVTAKKNDEFSAIWLNQSSVETSRFDVGGRMPNATGLNAMIYAERNIYRPGEVAHVSTIVRDESWNAPGEIPVKLKLTMPNGKEFATMRKILNREGSTETLYPIPHTALTGTYTLDVLSGNDVLLNSYAISVEDFVPDRIKSDLKIGKETYRPGETVTALLQANNLFGTPAMNRNYEAELNLKKVAFTSKAFPDYDFTIRKDFYESPQLHEGKTNEQGSARETFSLSEDLKDNGQLKGTIMATVFDETGRPVHRFASFDVFTQPYFIGIKNDYDYISTRSVVKVPLVALTPDGKPASNVTAQVELVKKEWHTAIEQTGDHYRYVSKKEEKVMARQALTIGGSGAAYSFTPQLSGEYEVRVSLPHSLSYVSKTFYAWGYDDSQYTSFEVNNEGQVDIKPDKDKYRQGEDMKFLFTTPFDGRMLVTIERDKVIEHRFLNTQDKSASLSLKAGDWAVPNIYVTATLFRPMGNGVEIPLTVAHGFRNVTVENPKDKLPVQVSLAPKSRSKTKQTITVKTAPHAFVTIAAVDEGILQVKNYETPDPYKYFYQKVALATNSYDIYPLLLPEIKSTLSSTGGDAAADEMASRVNPLFVNRIKNVSFWSGIVQADGNGNVRYDIDIPQFSGDIRAMVVAYKGRAFGGADQHMKVADPVVVSVGLPRVLSPKDQVLVPVTLSNTTGSAMNVTATIQTNGPLAVSGAMSNRVSIPANREARVVFNVAAQNTIGAGKITVQVNNGKETFTNETDIAVRPPASLQKITGSGQVNAGQAANILARANLIPSSIKGKLVFSKSPLVPFTKTLDFLLQYPYGCAEQTISTAFPQLYFTDLVKIMSGYNADATQPRYNVQEAINKIQGQQLSNGALSYWPGAGMGQESWWSSVYGAHFLLEAKKAGYEVNSRTLDNLLSYLRFKLQKRSTEILYYNQHLKKEIAAKEITYSLYVLALAGQPQPATMNYYKGNPNMLSIDGKYLLAAAYTLGGQPRQAREVMPPAFGNERSNQQFGGSFYSYIRDMAISLNALLDVDPGNPQVAMLSRTLSQAMQQQRYLNTQESAWGILALGKLARISNATQGTATLTAGGKTLAQSKGDAQTVDIRAYANQTLKLAVSGKGAFYYFWELSGISPDGSITEEDSYLRVRRQYFDRSGNPIDGTTFRQNQLIVVRLTLQSSWQGDVENVVVTDMLPAGFEIENTRLNEMPGMDWIKNEAIPDYLDYRDDRLNLFTTATTAPKEFYYMVRAVSPGVFQLGPVQADAMYNGAFHSYWGRGVARVVE